MTAVPHTYHRWKPPIWMGRQWWYDDWDDLIRWTTFRGCSNYSRCNFWRFA